MKNSKSMISVKEAMGFILNHTESFGEEIIPFKESLGRVIRETVVSDRDMPPFNRVSMDGIAIKSSVFQSGRRNFSIQDVQPAGSEQKKLLDPNHCLEAMTGAILPSGTDAVIPYELIDIENKEAIIRLEEIRKFQNIHAKGLDRKVNEVLIDKNQLISAAEIGVLATVGKSHVKVAKLPRIALVSTGDELVDVDQVPKPYQIRKSNVYTLLTLLEKKGIQADLFHLPDDKENLTIKIHELLETYDVMIFSGAVSKGKFDFLPEILDKLGVKKLFHRVKQRPGKPFWFGKKQKVTVFAFPGNPVSTFVSCLKYFMPWLEKSLEIKGIDEQFAILAEDFEFKPALNYFLQVRLSNEEGRLMAHPETGNGSGDLANLTLTDAFIELPAEKTVFRKGEVFRLIPFRA